MLKNRKLQSEWRKIIYGPSVDRFEDRLLLLTNISVFVVLVGRSIFNIFANLNGSFLIAPILGSLLYLCLYLFGRFISRGILYAWITAVISLLYIDYFWFLDYGSSGPIMPLFIVFYAFLILVFDNKHFLIISGILFLNMFFLALTEYHFKDHIGTYTDLKTNIIDHYVGILFSFMVIFSFTSAIKKNYIKEFKRAKMSDQLKSAFLANMSHEIRTPLNAIVGFSSLMYDDDIAIEEKKHFGGLIEQNSDYLLGLINDIVDVSTIESNQLILRYKEVDMVPILQNLIRILQGTISVDRQLEVKFILNEPKLIINTDPDRLVQILRNLLVNAIKYTVKGSIELDCRRELNFYTFSVKDTGVGIEPKYQQVIFDRFMKVETNKNHLYRGTGIGLFLSKQLVEMFGGKIWVESEVGKGSTFFFSIPA